jgi:hypothetical protein
MLLFRSSYSQQCEYPGKSLTLLKLDLCKHQLEGTNAVQFNSASWDALFMVIKQM